MLGGELQQICQFPERAARPEVIRVGLERHGIARIVLQDGVKVDRRLFAVAQAIVVQRRQLTQQRQLGVGVRGSFQLLLAQLGQLGEVVAAAIQLGQVLGRGASCRLDRDDLLVGSDRLFHVAERVLGKLCALGEDLDLLFGGARLADALAQEPVQVGKAAGVGEHPFEQGQRFRVVGHRGQGPAQGRHRVVHVPGLVATPRDLVVETRRPLRPVGAGPVGIGVHGRQRLQGLVVAGIKVGLRRSAFARPGEGRRSFRPGPARGGT